MGYTVGSSPAFLGLHRQGIYMAEKTQLGFSLTQRNAMLAADAFLTPVQEVFMFLEESGLGVATCPNVPRIPRLPFCQLTEALSFSLRCPKTPCPCVSVLLPVRGTWSSCG